MNHSFFSCLLSRQEVRHPTYQSHQAAASAMNESNFTNYYDDDYDDEVCDKGEVVRFGTITIPVFFSVVITLSLTGNILVLVILALYENLKSLTNIFILNLAVSDLVFTTGLPFWAIYHIWGWLFSEIICKIVTFVFFTGFYSSILFLTIMTVYRYVAVVHPLSGLRTQKLSTGIYLSFLLWIISIGAAMPSLLYSTLVSVPHKENHTMGCEYDSALLRRISIFQQNAFFLLAFVVMAFCYIKILRRISRTRSHTKNRAVKLVFCIVAVFFLGWVPYNVVIFLKMLADHLVAPFDDCEISIQLDYAFYVCRLIAFSHCCLNPVFYAFVGVKFRSHLKSMLHRMFSRQSPVDQQPVRTQALVSQGSMY
ncbi:chemokine (C motif) receptor 1a, duplicate 1 [Thunnus maccoyii]|uniref:chemokine (C motif) receptor 1a, duplicate 1 n=1 Tax=Thunnus maccoyii TaxID=8240 RepID=UPI001C4ABB35|nr:chemokine (C motif) receptor 1a, duplicate 1 [Thunnus maccoyii]